MLRHKRDCVKSGIGVTVWLSCVGRGKGYQCVVHVNLPSGFQKFINSNAIFFPVRR